MILTMIFVFLAAVCNAVMDKISFHFSKSVFRNLNPHYWNPVESWRAKWKNGDPSQGEAFFLSSTLLVAWTDAWHQFKQIMKSSWIAAIIFYTPWFHSVLDAAILFGIHTMTFGGFFSYIFHKEPELTPQVINTNTP